jgi:hypothetical protein
MNNDLNICNALIVYNRVYISFWVTVGITLIQVTIQFLSIYANLSTHKDKSTNISNEPSQTLHLYVTSCSVIRFVWVSSKFGTCTVESVNGTLVDAKIRIFKGECAQFSFNKCPVYTRDGGSSAKFSSNSHETDKSVVRERKFFLFSKIFLRKQSGIPRVSSINSSWVQIPFAVKHTTFICEFGIDLDGRL